MLGLIGNLDFSEVVIVVVAAILIFGKRLPRIAGQACFYLARARRSIETLWHETGVAREIQSVQRELNSTLPANLSLGEMARRASAEIQKQVDVSERFAREHTDFDAEAVPTTSAGPMTSAAPTPSASPAPPPALDPGKQTDPPRA